MGNSKNGTDNTTVENPTQPVVVEDATEVPEGTPVVSPVVVTTGEDDLQPVVIETPVVNTDSVSDAVVIAQVPNDVQVISLDETLGALGGTSVEVPGTNSYLVFYNWTTSTGPFNYVQNRQYNTAFWGR